MQPFLNFHRFLLAAAAMLLIGAAPESGAQSNSPAPAATASASPAPSASAQATPTPGPLQPYALADVPTQVDAALADQRETQENLSGDQTLPMAAKGVPELTAEITTRLEESSKVVLARPSLELLAEMEEGWKKLNETVAWWSREMAARVARLDGMIPPLQARRAIWDLTYKQPDVRSAPAEVSGRVKTLIASLKSTQQTIQAERGQVLALQDQVADQAQRIGDILARIKQARNQAVERLFIQDSPALWSAEVRSRTGEDLAQRSQTSFSNQVTDLRAFVGRHPESFLFHAVLFGLLLAGMHWVRRRVNGLGRNDPILECAWAVFDRPIATAVVLSLLGSQWIYPDAPRLFWAIWGAASLIPTILLLRRLLDPQLFPILYGLVGFYFFDELREIAASLPTFSRWLFLAEMAAGIVFMVWILRSARFPRAQAGTEPGAGEPPAPQENRFWKVLRGGARVAFVLFIVALAANVLGYVRLSNLFGDAVLGSAYLAVILYGGLRIMDGLVLSALSFRPLTAFKVVRNHRLLLWRRIRYLLHWVTLGLWAVFTLDLLALRDLVFERTMTILSATLQVGSLRLSLGNTVAFGLTVWATFLLSRFLRFMLQEEVYPRVQLARGLPYAISTMLHYAILLLGFFAAVGALGFNLTQFTILAGAFGVGLGFGLQNIFNNFISGLILLFERPVKVGDVIQLDGADGVVRRIGIRASVIETQIGSEMIVPNGRLISERLTNWTFSDRKRGIEIPISLPRSVDPKQVMALLERVAAAHPDVAKSPVPEAHFLKLGPPTFDFELRVWTHRYEQWVRIRSDLAVAINTALAQEQIPIA